MSDPQVNKPSEDILTDHLYDGIMEYDNPTPGWWHLIFFGTIVFSLLYFPVYHFSPLILTPEEQVAAQERKADHVNHALALRADTAPADDFDQDKEQASAVECGQREQIGDGQCGAQNG